ncbi:MAG: hypothetical protein WB709_01345 [Solirubrobacteraceae bacterium]
MVFEKPIIDKRELLRALDPVHGRGGVEYDRLRRARLLSMGVTDEGADSGSAKPAIELFCSLNRDAISAVRRGHTQTARDIREHAQRIERSTIGPWLKATNALQPTPEEARLELSPEDDGRQSWIDRVFFAVDSDDDSEVAEPIWNAAQEVAEVRAHYEEEDATARLTVGRVWKIDEIFSELRALTPSVDNSFAFFSDEVFAAGLRLGDPVVIRHEELAPGIFLTTLERGVERDRRVSRISGQPLPRHLDELLDSSELAPRKRLVRPLRQIA